MRNEAEDPNHRWTRINTDGGKEKQSFQQENRKIAGKQQMDWE
jgi:hypothetical protein